VSFGFQVLSYNPPACAARPILLRPLGDLPGWRWWFPPEGSGSGPRWKCVRPPPVWNCAVTLSGDPIPWQQTAKPYCKKCDPRDRADMNRRTGEWSKDCEFETEAECKAKCTTPAPIVPCVVRASQPAPVAMSPLAEGERDPASAVGVAGMRQPLAGTRVPHGFGFQSSGGMLAKCACDDGFAWQKQGDHPCGCHNGPKHLTSSPGKQAASRARSHATSVMQGSGELASAAAANRECGPLCCCCIDKMVVKDLKPRVIGSVNPVYTQPFTVRVDFRMLGAGGGVPQFCDYEWWEASSETPSGYPSWDPNGWNAAHVVPGFDATATRAAFLRAQRTLCDRDIIDKPHNILGEDTPGMSASTYFWATFFGRPAPVLIFARAKSGCPTDYLNYECENHCVAIRVVYGTPTPIVDVIGPWQGACDMPVLAKAPDGKVSVGATWQSLIQARGWPWRMSGGRS